MARLLAAAGHGVLWMPSEPNVVRTSADHWTVNTLSVANRGKYAEDWLNQEKIDVDMKRGV